MRRLLVAVLVTLLVALSFLPAASALAQDDVAPTAEPTLHMFWAEGCPYCAAEKVWLSELQERYPQLAIRQYEISRSESNRQLWLEMTGERGVEPSGVPTTILGDRVWVGFDETRIGPVIEAAVAEAVADTPPADPSESDAAAATTISIPFVGDVDVGSSSLVMSTLLIGFVDGFNPCSLWVLSLLLALVLHTGSRRRVLIVGGTFLVITTALYGVYMAGLYSILSYIAYVTWIRIAVAGVAGVFGVIGIKDYFAFHGGPTMSIPESRKPGIYRRMRSLAAADRPLPAVIGGTVVMAVGVSLVETPCTAGFPVIWTNLLAANGTTPTAAGALFALYMLVFLLDELAIFGVAVVTMRATKLQEKHGRLLKLVGGVVMLTLAAVMIIEPALLESLTGTAVVFGGAGLVTLTVVSLHRLLRGSPTPARRHRS